jgi:hypothetical protein
MKNEKAGLECCLVIFARILETKLKKGMRRILLLLIIMASASAYGQTYIKLNAPLVFAKAFNPSIETRISNKWTFEFDMLMTFRNETNDKGPFRILMLQPEGRYYFKEVNKGFFVGINTGYAMFRMTKPHWIFKEDYDASHIYQMGWSVQAGFTIGYEMKIKDRWLIDVFFGGGRQWSIYEAFYYPDGGRYVGYNGSAEYLPYKGGVNISYRLGK